MEKAANRLLLIRSDRSAKTHTADLRCFGKSPGIAEIYSSRKEPTYKTHNPDILDRLLRLRIDCECDDGGDQRPNYLQKYHREKDFGL
jgi:hypothetical protein